MKKWVVVSLFLTKVLFAQDYLIAVAPDSTIAVGMVRATGSFGIGIPGYDYGNGWLLYGDYRVGGGGSVLTNFWIDSTVYTNSGAVNEEYGLPLVSPRYAAYSSIENIVYADWYIAVSPGETLKITQTLYPFSIDSVGSVTIRYTITNLGTMPHRVGILLLLDTNINGRDDAPFYFPDGTVVQRANIFPRDMIPPYWQVYEEGPWYPDTVIPPQIVAKCVMEGAPNVKPDRVAVGNMTGSTPLYSFTWEILEIDTEYIADAGVILRWDPDTVAPGSVITFATTYGLAPEGAFIGGLLAARLEVPHRLAVTYCDLYPNPFNMLVHTRNNTDKVFGVVKGKITFDDTGLQLVNPADSVKTLAEYMLPTATAISYWDLIIATPPLIDTVFRYTIRLTTTYVDTTDTSIDTVNVETIIHDSIIVGGSDYIGPVATLIMPLESTYTSDSLQPIKIVIDPGDASLRIRTTTFGFIDAAGDTTIIPWGTSYLSFSGDTLVERPLPVPGDFYRDGDIKRFALLRLDDAHGCPRTGDTTGWFVVDRTYPDIYEWYPNPEIDTLVMRDSLMNIWIRVEDRLCRVDTMLTEFLMIDSEDSVVHTFPNPLLHYAANETLFYIPSMGRRIPDGWVTYGLVRVCDAMDYGLPNCNPLCPISWTFVMNSHGPRAHPITPYDGWYVADSSPNITFYLYDGNGIDPSTIHYTVDGISFGAPTEREWRDSLIIHSTTAVWENGYVVNVTVTDAIDSFNTPLEMSSHVSWSFTIDLSSSILDTTIPGDGATITDPTPSIEFTIIDSLAGLNYSTMIVSVAGEEYEWGMPEIVLITGDRNRGHFRWDCPSSSPLPHGPMSFCVDIDDSVHMGTANHMHQCVNFIIAPEPPVVSFPGIEHGNLLCFEDGIVSVPVIIEDEDGIDVTSVSVLVESDGEPIPGNFTFSEPNLLWNSSSPLSHGDTIEFCIENVADLVGVSIEEPVCTVFIVAVQPPIANNMVLTPFTTDYETYGILDSIRADFIFNNTVAPMTGASVYILDASGTDTLATFSYPLTFIHITDTSVVFHSTNVFTFIHGYTYFLCVSASYTCYSGEHEKDRKSVV